MARINVTRKGIIKMLVYLHNEQTGEAMIFYASTFRRALLISGSLIYDSDNWSLYIQPVGDNRSISEWGKDIGFYGT